MNKKICTLPLFAMCFCLMAYGCSSTAVEKSTTSTSAITTSTSTTQALTKQATTKKSTLTQATTKIAKQSTTKKKTTASTTKKNTSRKETTTTTSSSTVSCTVTVECSSVLKHIDDLKEGHEEFVPSDGYIINSYTYIGKKGDTAYDALKAACNKNDIKLTSQKSVYGIYISGINNLDEYDCGNQSGWMYSINGVRPSVTCGDKRISDSDNIVFNYVCEYQ